MLRATLDSALTATFAFREARITALELEERLVALGFYNIEFSPCAAAFDGVRYDLEPTPQNVPLRAVLAPIVEGLDLP